MEVSLNILVKEKPNKNSIYIYLDGDTIRVYEKFAYLFVRILFVISVGRLSPVIRFGNWNLPNSVCRAISRNVYLWRS